MIPLGPQRSALPLVALLLALTFIACSDDSGSVVLSDADTDPIGDTGGDATNDPADDGADSADATTDPADDGADLGRDPGVDPVADVVPDADAGLDQDVGEDTGPVVPDERVYVEGCSATLPGDPEPLLLTPIMPAATALLGAPVDMVMANDGSGRVFIVNQSGSIVAVDGLEDSAGAEVWLDIRGTRGLLAGGERGLLGMALPADFGTSAVFYVYYSSNEDPPGENNYGQHSRVSRFTVTDGDGEPDPSGTVDYDSEQIVFTVRQPAGNHNGGQIGFHPDEPDNLYIGLGDGGGGNDTYCNGQDTGSLLGSMLRIDVGTGNDSYQIPDDNPFVDDEGALDEIYAYGLRNPWRWSFDTDPDSGVVTLWAGDVGQGAEEEIDHIVAGGNYGWPLYEGYRESSSWDCEDYDTEVEVIEPVDSYPRSLGNVVSGGQVYRGAALPDLAGAYIYGDFGSGRLFALRSTEEGWQRQTLLETSLNPSAFGRDQNGEVYVLDHTGGQVLRLEPNPQTGVTDGFRWVARLSDTGCFEDLPTQRLAPDAIHFSVNAPLWSDGATKSRALILPDDGLIGFDVNDAWEVPVGTQVIKSFFVDGDPIETRFLLRRDEGWVGATYIWNADGTDAELAVEAETRTLPNEQAWFFPGAGDCLRCHTDAAGRLLGVRTPQLNREHDVFGLGATNIVDGLAEVGYFEDDIPGSGELPALPDLAIDPPDDDGEWSRAYLDSNCSHCHRPGGPTGRPFDLTWQPTLAETGICDVAPTDDLGLGEAARLLAPGEPGNSVILTRMDMLGGAQMPPLARNVIDQRAVEILVRWAEEVECE